MRCFARVTRDQATLNLLNSYNNRLTAHENFIDGGRIEGCRRRYCPYSATSVDQSVHIVHIRSMDAVISDLLTKTGGQIRTRRLAMGLTQADAAARAGVAYRTWRRMEKDGSASIEDLIRAAIACAVSRG